MTSRSQLEGLIAEKLVRLSAEDMQRVAEDYARIRFPERFPRFDFRAFSLEGKSRPGWPDAWIDVGGRIDGVEATVDKTKAAVKQHLADDLQKATERAPSLAGLMIVSGHPSVQFTSEEVDAWRKRFVDEAGIAADRIHLIFGGGLVEELARPEFARTRIEVLGLPVGPRHFKLVLAKRGPDEIRLSDFIPSDDDYALGRVHRPALADQVLAQLDRSNCALVRGVGACGKSVLAWLLALEVTEQRRPAYMLDLADYIDASPDAGSKLVEELHRFSHPLTLFVLDNCHLNESLAKEVVLAWQTLEKSQRWRLLLLGRELRTSRGSLIDGLNIAPLALKARQQEVRGVYLRLAWRHTGDQPPPEPPSSVLDDWVHVFGGDPHAPDTTTDLIAFSAAVRGRMTDLLNRRWTLCEADATHEIRAVYLKKLSEDETQNLMRLCAVEALELSLSDEALVNRRAGFDVSSNRLGLVFRKSAGSSGQHIRYRLAHAALGRLILRSAFLPVDAVAERQAAAVQYPFGGCFMMRRLVETGQALEAKNIASQLMIQPAFMLDFGSLAFSHAALRTLQSAGVVLPEDLGQTLVAGPMRKKLLNCALQTPLHFCVSFLNYVLETTVLKPVLDAIAADLLTPDNKEELVKQALQTPLHLLVRFLAYTAQTDPLKPVFKALADSLALPQNRQTLVERAIETPLDFLASFLSYAAKTAALKPVFKAVCEDLLQPKNCRVLAIAMEHEPLTALVGALQSKAASELWAAVFSAVDDDAWERAKRSEAVPTINAFVTFQRIATEAKRPELAEAPALRLVASSTREEWHQSGIGLHHLSHVLRFARRVTLPDIEHFLDRVTTPNWIDDLIKTVPAGGLAGNVFSFATVLPPHKRRWFLRESLKDRVVRDLARLRASDTEPSAQALALLGASACIGVCIPELQIGWPNSAMLAEVLQLRMPRVDSAMIGPMQIQLWVGLREMARLNTNLVAIPSAIGERILILWQATEESAAMNSLPPHVRDLNASMILWLQQCEIAGWRLVVPQRNG